MTEGQNGKCFLLEQICQLWAAHDKKQQTMRILRSNYSKLNRIRHYFMSAHLPALARPLKNPSNPQRQPQSPTPPQVHPITPLRSPHQTLHLPCQGGFWKHSRLGLHRRDQGQSLQEGKDRGLHGRRGQGLHGRRGQGLHGERGQRRQRVCGPQIGSEPAGKLAHPVAPDLSTGNRDSSISMVYFTKRIHTILQTH